MERIGNNIAEDTFLYWLEVERYMTQFKEGNFENCWIKSEDSSQ